MIPKIIHYCWFGGNPLPKSAEKCIKSWKKYCPDYEIIEWNESNFDINSNRYVREAYENKKYAFVTDFVRLYAMYNYGGIYMDTDVEVLKPLDCFLNNHAFSGFESNEYIPTGLMASEKEFPLFEELLKYYENRAFVNSDGSFDTTTNTVIITNACKNRGLVLNNEFQVVDGFALYPKDYFCVKNTHTGIIEKTQNSFSIHHFNATWNTKEERQNTLKRWNKYKKERVKQFPKLLLRKIIGDSTVDNIKRIIFKK